MSKLAETYFHLDLNLDENNKSILKDFLVSRAPLYAEDVYLKRLEFSVYVEDGSLKVWLAAAGALYAAVAAYGSFRSGVDYLVQDARIFSEKVLAEVKQSGVPEERIINFQRRLGVPGQIKRVLADTRKLDRDRAYLTDAEQKLRLMSIRKAMERISKNLDYQEDADLLRHNLPGLLADSIPKRLPGRHIEEARMIALKPEEYESLSDSLNGYHALPAGTVNFNSNWDNKVFDIEQTVHGIRFTPK